MNGIAYVARLGNLVTVLTQAFEVQIGLSAAALQGAPVLTQDVGLWFEDLTDPNIREAVREIGAAYAPQSVWLIPA